MAPIHLAAQLGNLNRVRALLNQGVPVNTRNLNRNWAGWTPLHYAAKNGHLNIVKELIRRGAHVNARTRTGRTPLHFALNPRIIHALIKAGANPKYRNRYGISVDNFTFTLASRNALRTSRAATKWQNYRKKSIARKRASPNTLARTVFSPSRVRTMMKQYGNNWMNKI